MGLLSAEELDDILSPANLLRPQYKGRSVKNVVAQPGQDTTGPTG